MRRDGGIHDDIERVQRCVHLQHTLRTGSMIRRG